MVARIKNTLVSRDNCAYVIYKFAENAGRKTIVNRSSEFGRFPVDLLK